MAEKYDHKLIEKKWQERWLKDKVFVANNVTSNHPLTPPFSKEGAAPASPRPSLRKATLSPRDSTSGRRGVYVLDMFPYPSGDGLHVGHPEGYTATDIYSRYLRMNGKKVLHPMGWDAFGLPAENAAIKKGIHPSVVTEQNIANFKRQIQSLGFSYDWDREINTTDPKYYKWTQWIFLQLFKKGLAYEKEAPIWWCPKDKTGLANEEVVNGKCDRCGTAVEKKMMKQWMLKITDYAERLLAGLDKLDWPDSIKALQRNWIGKSEGAVVRFKISDLSGEVEVFTTRPDTLFGATYLVLSPEHELVKKITTAGQKKSVDAYIKSVSAKSDRERMSEGEKDKTGVFTGAYAINPVNNEKIPVWIADYVLSSYGTGAIMAVPAHDERDFAFAKTFELAIKPVIYPEAVTVAYSGNADIHKLQEDVRKKILAGEECYSFHGEIINSPLFDGLRSDINRDQVVNILEAEKIAVKKVQYKLRDWVFSRQRYWGEPIPLVKCESCKLTVESTPYYLHFYKREIWDSLSNGTKTIETRALNPDEPERYFGKIEAENYIKAIFKPTGEIMWLRVKNVKTYKNLKSVFQDKELLRKKSPGRSFKNVDDLVRAYDALVPGYANRIDKHGLIAFEVKRVIPGIILDKEESLPIRLPDVEKYEPTGTGESPLANVDEWVNVTCRVCGHPAKRETNTMPQWAGSCWYYLRFCDPNNEKEFASAEAMKAWLPVDMYVGGAEHAVLHLLYARFWHMVLYDIGAIPEKNNQGESLAEPFRKLKNQGLILGPDGEKMSKSRGNVINPDEIVEKYGADTLRLYEMFMGPFEDAKPWDTNGIVGVRRFLDKVWRLQETLIDSEEGQWTGNASINIISNDIKSFKLNTAVSQFMKLANMWGTKGKIRRNEYETFLKLLHPFAPHITEEIWHRVGNKTLLATEKWPKYDPKKDVAANVTVAVQVMGKLRGTLVMPSGASQADVESAAKSEPNVAKYLTSNPKKVVFVKDKLINFVI